MMKLCHAAALVLVGWYLMLLPKSGGGFRFSGLPWSVTQRSFDTAKECEEARAKAVAPPGSALAAAVDRAAVLRGLPGGAAAVPVATPKGVPMSMGTPESALISGPPAAKSAKPVESDSAFYCIATDDPRLKSAY